MESDREAEQRALNRRLAEAVQTRCLDRVQQLLSAGADPNCWGEPWGATPLLHAAMLGFEEIAEALFAAGADPDRGDFDGSKPLAAATVKGHEGTARLIQCWLSSHREQRRNQQLDRLGWVVGVRGDETEIRLAGTEKVDNPDRIIELSWAEAPLETEIPFTSFEGWIKQIDVQRFPAIALEAVRAGLPWFFDLADGPEDLLAAIPGDRTGKSWRFTGQRPRRFAGDDALPKIALLHSLQR